MFYFPKLSSSPQQCYLPSKNPTLTKNTQKDCATYTISLWRLSEKNSLAAQVSYSHSIRISIQIPWTLLDLLSGCPPHPFGLQVWTHQSNPFLRNSFSLLLHWILLIDFRYKNSDVSLARYILLSPWQDISGCQHGKMCLNVSTARYIGMSQLKHESGCLDVNSESLHGFYPVQNFFKPSNDFCWSSNSDSMTVAIWITWLESTG